MSAGQAATEVLSADEITVAEVFGLSHRNPTLGILYSADGLPIQGMITMSHPFGLRLPCWTQRLIWGFYSRPGVACRKLWKA